ncbi:Sodium/proline symporter [Enhygromyxa salina]|uniref:Sodium/proline symporter n=1 Tax=Enhygromyxa salina TaxID=215803 RepID=A0A0C1Z6Q2_9BACT|nr:sodium/proline symporter [Enhygromyxa salina]KIG13299.1 Sodium/proline symporter [Enhygromyxa salina]
MSRTQAILWTLVVYQLAMVSIGAIAQRYAKDDSDYFLGGRSLGPVVAALSASASSSSVWTLIGVSGFAYGFGLAAIWLLPACVGGFALNWFVLAPALRRVAREQGAITVTELLAGPPGSERRRAVITAASLIILLSLLTYVAAQFQGAGKAFADTFDIRFEWALLLGGGIVVLYTMLGGFWAVSLTDTLQGLMMALAAVLLPIAALYKVGLAGILASLDGDGQGLWAAATNGLPAAAAIGFVLGLLGIGLGYPGQPHVVNRFMALRDERGVVVGRRISMSWAVVIYAGMIVLGWSVRVLAPDLPGREDAFLRGTELLLSPVLAGIMVAALLSAIMSTADSQLLVAASTISHDLLGDAGTKQLNPGAQLRRSRATVLAVSIGALLVALWVDETIFSSVLFAWTAMGSAFGPLLLVTVWRGRPRAWAVLTAMLAGFTLSVAAHLWPVTNGGAFERVLPFVIALAVAYAGAPRRPR